jgi:hypothetical protein
LLAVLAGVCIFAMAEEAQSCPVRLWSPYSVSYAAPPVYYYYPCRTVIIVRPGSSLIMPARPIDPGRMIPGRLDPNPLPPPPPAP